MLVRSNIYYFINISKIFKILHFFLNFGSGVSSLGLRVQRCLQLGLIRTAMQLRNEDCKAFVTFAPGLQMVRV